MTTTRPEIRAIVFDLYGVLALNGWQAFKVRHGAADWPAIAELGRRVDAGLAGYDDLIAAVAKLTGESEAAVCYQLEHTLPNDGLLAYIRTELKPYYRLGILSNASTSKVIDAIFRPEDEALFDAIVLSHHTGLTKPQTGMYHAITARLGVEPATCLFVDDQERHVAGAIAAGMQAVVFAGIDGLRQRVGELTA